MDQGEIIIYQTPDGQTELDVKVEKETIWLTQKQIAELFGTKRPAITKHLKNIFAFGELDEQGTCSILEHIGNNTLVALTLMIADSRPEEMEVMIKVVENLINKQN